MQMIGKERHLYFMGSRLADGSSALILFIDFCPTLFLNVVSTSSEGL